MHTNHSKLSVRHLLATIGPESFGQGSVALNLVREQRELGIDAKIWCLDNIPDIRWAAASSALSPECIVGFQRTGPVFLGYSLEMERAAGGSEGESIDIIHQHGVWTGVSRVANRWRDRFHGPTIVAPHGSFEEWAIKRSVWKKRLALAVYESKNLKEAACFHATALPEVEGIQQFGYRRPIAVIQNGISDEWLESDGLGAEFRSKYELPAGCRMLLYLGRITPVKNLGMLIEAMASMKDILHDWLLVIAGKDEFDHQREVEVIVKQHKLEPWVRFIGLIDVSDKRNAFSAAEIFVLPSRKEASPMVVLEALGAAIPVLTTKGTPWQDLVTYNCGWWSDVSIDSLRGALYNAISMSKDELRMMGERGRQLVMERYRWSTAARESLRLYEWLLGRAGQPEFVLNGGPSV